MTQQHKEHIAWAAALLGERHDEVGKFIPLRRGPKQKREDEKKRELLRRHVAAVILGEEGHNAADLVWHVHRLDESDRHGSNLTWNAAEALVKEARKAQGHWKKISGLSPKDKAAYAWMLRRVGGENMASSNDDHVLFRFVRNGGNLGNLTTLIKAGAESHTVGLLAEALNEEASIRKRLTKRRQAWPGQPIRQSVNQIALAIDKGGLDRESIAALKKHLAKAQAYPKRVEAWQPTLFR